jgi:hypothetical protein
MRRLCHHYVVELHNFTPNAISQAATFVGVSEGFLGIPVNWDLWVHLFHAELHTLATTETQVRRAVHTGGLSISLRDTHREFYIPYTMTSNNAEWEWGWFYRQPSPLHRQGAEGEGRLLAPQRVSLLALGTAGFALELVVGPGGCQVGTASVLANLHHMQIVPLMERELRIYEMSEAANPTSLVHSLLLHDRFPREYATTRARHAISLKAGRHSNDDLWSFVMLPNAPAVSRPSHLPRSLAMHRCGFDSCLFSRG